MEQTETLEQVCAEYKLSEEERSKIGREINNVMLEGKETSSNQ